MFHITHFYLFLSSKLQNMFWNILALCSLLDAKSEFQRELKIFQNRAALNLSKYLVHGLKCNAVRWSATEEVNCLWRPTPPIPVRKLPV
jgi:hypothetical protein